MQVLASTKLFEDEVIDGGSLEDGTSAFDLEPLKDGTSAFDIEPLKDGTSAFDLEPLQAGTSAVHLEPLQDGTSAFDLEPLQDGTPAFNLEPLLQDGTSAFDLEPLQDGTSSAKVAKTSSYCKPLPCGHQAISKTMKSQKENWQKKSLKTLEPETARKCWKKGRLLSWSYLCLGVFWFFYLHALLLPPYAQEKLKLEKKRATEQKKKTKADSKDFRGL